MTYEDYIQDAFDLVSAWDLPDDELPDAVNVMTQRSLLRSLELDRSSDLTTEPS
jgi:hypothetical protein